MRGPHLLGWDLDASHHAVDRVGGLDLAARDAEEKQHSVQIRVAQRRVGDLPQRRFGVECDTQPAAASMSMSLAPSPTATVCSIGTPACSREVPQRLGFTGAVDDRADDPAGDFAVDDLQLVGGDEVQHQLLRQRLDDLPEAAGDHAHV